MKILVTGSSGLVGSRYTELSKYKNSFLTPGINNLDITNKAFVENYFSENSFDAVINFAAFTDVKKAEKEKGQTSGLCYKLNVDAVKNLVNESVKKGVFFVQISTDLVFEGLESLNDLYIEDDIPTKDSNKVSWYGYTKGLGENAVREAGVSYAICRIAYPFSSKQYPLKNDLAHNIIQLYQTKSLYPLFSDNVITPTYLDFLAPQLDLIVENKINGTFHLVLDQSTSHYGFAKKLFEKMGFDSSVLAPSSMKEFLEKNSTPRALNASLDTRKTEKVLNLKTRTLEEALDHFAKNYQSL